MISKLKISEPTTTPIPASEHVYKEMRLVKSSGPLQPRAQIVAPATASSPQRFAHFIGFLRMLSTKTLMAGTKYASQTWCWAKNMKPIMTNQQQPTAVLPCGSSESGKDTGRSACIFKKSPITVSQVASTRLGCTTDGCN